MNPDKQTPNVEPSAPPVSPISRADVWDRLLLVEDPELGVDIVNLGLVRDVTLQDATVRVLMTLTSIGCPIAEDLEAAVKARLQEVSGVKEVTVAFTFEPPWSPEAITEDGRDQLLALGYI